MKVRFTAIPHKLLFRHPFRIAHGIRLSTDVVYLRAECVNAVGFGEATLPPYLGVSTAEVLEFFKLPVINEIEFPFSPNDVLINIDRQIPGMMPAKAALDMALWSLLSQLDKKSFPELFDVKTNERVPHSFTIGVCDEVEFSEKIQFARSVGFDFFKLKFDGVHDRQMIEMYTKMEQATFAIDVNQAWSDAEEMFGFVDELARLGCVLIEQPFHRDDLEQTALLRQHTNIPVIADEACQRIFDIPRIQESFDGINIKLQKCGGLSEARRMITDARSRDLKVLIGCMSESSVGCNAAEVLSPLCNWADLDGPWLIRNDDELMQEIGYKKSLR